MYPHEYSYSLPEELIAQHPASERDLSRLMSDDGSIEYFRSIAEKISADDILFCNNTKVIRARVVLMQSKHKRGGVTRIRERIEIFFIEQKTSHTFEAMISPGKWFKIGDIIETEQEEIEVVGITEHGRILSISGSSISEFFESYGNLPLPPYIEYSREKEERYQSIFGSQEGALAAPTASLHFTPEIFDILGKKGVEKREITLHVGLGTFKHIDPEKDVGSITLHSEEFLISVSILEEIAQSKTRNKSILAVGTTVVRTLESLPLIYPLIPAEIRKTLTLQAQHYWEEMTAKSKILNYTKRSIPEVLYKSYDHETNMIKGSTQIFIYEPYEFLIVDRLITNFHLPESSLLMLVCAFAGKDRVMPLYKKAVTEKMRFFSFGDAMILKKTR